jgi:hypothetical protein
VVEDTDARQWDINSSLVLPDGRHYFPDLMIKVKERSKGNGILLIEVKGEFLINSLNTPDKALA